MTKNVSGRLHALETQFSEVGADPAAGWTVAKWQAARNLPTAEREKLERESMRAAGMTETEITAWQKRRDERRAQADEAMRLAELDTELGYNRPAGSEHAKETNTWHHD